jgi:hypothetical protein
MMDYVIPEFKKVFPMSALVFLVSIQFSFGLALCFTGLFLLIDHMHSYGRWDLKDITGHETIGIILLLSGLAILGHFFLLALSLSTYLVFCKYKWEDSRSPIEYAIAKLTGG